MNISLLEIWKAYMDANNGQTIEQSIFCAKECLKHFREIVTPETAEAARTFLLAAIRNPYLIGIPSPSAKNIAEWALVKAIEFEKEFETKSEKEDSES